MSTRFQPFVTVAAIIECRGKFLLVSEYDEAPDPVYGQPAGHLEKQEDLIEAVTREIKEETGFNLEFELCSVQENFTEKDNTKIKPWKIF